MPRTLALALAAVCGLLAWVLNTPIGSELAGPERFFLAPFGLVGCVLAAIGLVLARPGLAWSGAGVFAGLTCLFPAFWYAVPFSLGLLGCVLAWERARPRPPPPPPAPPPWSYGWPQPGYQPPLPWPR